MKMRKKVSFGLCVCTAAILALVLASCPRLQQGTIRGSLVVDGAKRSYFVHVPEGLDAKAPVPLLIALHPFTGTGSGMEKSSGFSAIADREGFIVAYPDGRQRVWNANPDQPSSILGKPADDVAFIDSLIDALIAQYPIDADRVYVAGASSGGLMTHRIAAALTGKLAAAASVMITLPTTWPDSVIPAGPLPFLMIQGKADPFFPWDGGVVEEGPSRTSTYLSAAESVGYWVANNDAEPNAKKEDLPDADPDDGTTVYREVHTAKTGGQKVVFYGVRGGGHTWPGSSDFYPEFLVGKTSQDIDASEVIWAFFTEHVRN